MTFTKVAAVFDEHRPYSINLNPVYNFIYDFKPNVFIKGGDTLDLAYLSHWNELAPGKWKNHNLNSDYEAEGELLDEVKNKINPDKMVYMIGNHEHWVKQYIDKFPYLKDTVDVPVGLKLKQRGIQCIPLNKSFKIGHLHFIHGIYTSQNHAKQTAMAYQRCIRYGHTHDHQVHSVVSALDEGNVYNAMSCGCLCKRNAEYMHGKPNKWQHGLYVAYIFPNGNFTDYFIPIINNKFVWNGKVYQ
jgi:hypothetical protein